MQDRSWAMGLKQDQFAHEYLQRCPFSDVIPDVNEWVKKTDEKYNTISGVKPEDYEIKDGPVKQVDVTPKEYSCRGCGRIFKHPLGRSAHERRCKVKLMAGGGE